MALLHADNFTIYGANANFMLNGVYADVGSPNAGGNNSTDLVTDPDGISSGRVLSTRYNSGYGLVRRVLPGLRSSAGIAARVWMPSLPSGPAITPTYVFQDTSNVVLASMGIDPTGRITFNQLDPGGINQHQLAITSAPVVTANGWFHIECQFSTATSGGLTTFSWQIRVEGIPVLTGSTVLPASSPTPNPNLIASVSIGNYTVAETTYYFKDFVVWDTTGSQNNTFLGSVLVINLVPDADTTLNGWTPSTGTTGFPILSDIPPDDTKFITAAVGQINTQYKGSVSNLPSNVTSVKGVITYVRAAKTDGGDGSLQNGVISGSSTGLGANRPITVAQTYWQDVFELDPATTNPWLPAAVNAMNYQINRTT